MAVLLVVIPPFTMKLLFVTVFAILAVSTFAEFVQVGYWDGMQMVSLEKFPDPNAPENCGIECLEAVPESPDLLNGAVLNDQNQQYLNDLN